MFPTELEINQRRIDMQQEAEQYRQAKAAREPRRSLFGLLRDRLNAVQAHLTEFSAGESAAQQPRAIA